MKAGDLLIDESEIVESFVRASGPGGQNVNKVASAVELRFDARRSPSLPDDVATRLIRLAGARATQDGVIVIFAQRFSSQPRNREDARARLAGALDEGAGAGEAAPGDPADPRLASPPPRRKEPAGFDQGDAGQDGGGLDTERGMMAAPYNPAEPGGRLVGGPCPAAARPSMFRRIGQPACQRMRA